MPEPHDHEPTDPVDGSKQDESSEHHSVGDDAAPGYDPLPSDGFLFLRAAVDAQGTPHGLHERQRARGEQYGRVSGFTCRTDTATEVLGAFIDDLLDGVALPTVSEAAETFASYFVRDDSDTAPSWADFGWDGTERPRWLQDRMTGLLTALATDYPMFRPSETGGTSPA